jgi:hypothetical protein
MASYSTPFEICGDFLPISVTPKHYSWSDIIIPATMSSDCPMSEPSDPFTADIIPNSFPLSTENKVSHEGDPFEHLELSPNKRYVL